MSETTNSHAQQIKNTWTKAVDDGVARLSAAMEEGAKLESKGVAQATQAIEELAKLQRDSLGYLVQLSAEWRKLTLEATKRTAELFAARS
ncbi:MAG: hypothetical protein FJ096_11125 [Deltaproteobacteria bacterium]|nr:hypothetical protein [Deltaproteobacteria bacterium]